MKKMHSHILTHMIVLLALFNAALPLRIATAYVCPLNMSELDCEAIRMGWTDWKPDNAIGCGTTGATGAMTSTDNNKNLETVYNYFLGKGLTKIQAAAIVGNIAHESGGDPQNTQGGYSPDRTQDPTQVSPASGGWGLIQWTPAAKVIGIAEKANITSPIYELQTQLDIVWWHMNNTSPTGKQNMLAGFTQTDLMEAVVYYELTMEGAGDKAYDARFKAAQIALKYTKNSSAEIISAGTGCQCSASNAANVGGAGTVVLDPGHSGIDKQGKEKDPETGLYIGDSSNPTERKQAWDVAVKIKSMLEAKGYKVVMTKQSESDYVSLKQRAIIANEANAAIAVSIHNTPGQFGGSVAWTTPQKVGNYRVNDSGVKTTFSDAGVANKSQQYAQAILDARKAAGEGGTNIHDIVFDGRAGLSGGNLSIVQLFSKVPWVYNETGQTGFNSDVYAKGIAEGIMKAVKPASTGTLQASRDERAGRSIASSLRSFFSPTASAQDATQASSGDCSGAASGNAVQTAINYAWPTYHAPPYTTLKPSYEAAVKAAQKAGKYVGGGTNPGVDCGGFVTRVMQDSGVDPKYGGGGNVVYQHKHIRESGLYKVVPVKTTADLRPGDIAIAFDEGHTFMYVGPGHTGTNGDGSPTKFDTSIASASYSTTGASWRSPMAGHENPLTKNYIYRYVGEAL